MHRVLKQQHVNFVVEEEVFQGQDTYFERDDWVQPTMDIKQEASDPVSIQSCAEACVEDCSCFGFTYHPLKAQCGLLMSTPADFIEAETRSTEVLQYLIHRAQQNIAKGELLLTLIKEFDVAPCINIMHILPQPPSTQPT